jgi:hypothetical protein
LENSELRKKPRSEDRGCPREGDVLFWRGQNGGVRIQRTRGGLLSILLVGDEMEGFLQHENGEADLFCSEGVAFAVVVSILKSLLHGRVKHDACFVALADGSFPYGDLQISTS